MKTIDKIQFLPEPEVVIRTSAQGPLTRRFFKYGLTRRLAGGLTEWQSLERDYTLVNLTRGKYPGFDPLDAVDAEISGVAFALDFAQRHTNDTRFPHDPICIGRQLLWGPKAGCGRR